MASYLTIVNSVLKKMREPTVATVSANTLSALVGSFVNDAKREVEDAWQWSHLQDQFSAAWTVANAGVVRWNAQNLVGTGAHATERANIWQDPNTDAFLVRLDDAGIEQLVPQTQYGDRGNFVLVKQRSNQTFTGIPDGFYLTSNGTGVTSGDSIKVINTTCKPDKTYNFTVIVKNPQADLALDADNMLIPTAPVLMRAYLFALYERGEELGEALTLTSTKADQALADAIADDTKTQKQLQLVCE